ncbi:OmpA family protein [Thioalkalivibrio sp. ALR17-21]|uniref:OmpA family protein n=1 Tax=Thioalkalivibrio sp. ALR17-21 TaxID=1269813 RepID=UPI00040B803A|nr:OmpA family protein [Thioalkalivibrio sp. ALR17-21]
MATNGEPEPAASARDQARSRDGDHVLARDALAPETGRSPDSLREDEHAWILTYLDVLTLVIVVFVIMLTFAEPRDESIRAADDDPVELVYRDLSNLVDPRLFRLSPEAPEVPPGPVEDPPLAADPPSPVATPADDPPPEADPEAVRDMRDRAPEGVEVIEQPGSIELRIQDDILFATAQADLAADGQALLDDLLPLLEEHEGRVTIEGHTDNVPIATPRFPSNWELSSTRASGVVRYLVDRGINPGILQAVGHADTRPVADNDTPEGRAENRRVSIVLETPADS